MKFYWLKQMKLSEQIKEEIVWTVEQNSPVREMYCHTLQCFVQPDLLFEVQFFVRAVVFYICVCISIQE